MSDTTYQIVSALIFIIPALFWVLVFLCLLKYLFSKK